MTKPIAIVETGVRPKFRYKVTSYGKPISLTETLRAMKPGQSFKIDHHIQRGRVTSTAHYLGMKVTTHKEPDGMLLVTLL